MELKGEIRIKLSAVREYLEVRELQGVFLSRRDNFAWLSGGKDNHVVNSSEIGFFSLLVTKDNQYLVSDNVELPRAQTEELMEMMWEPLVFDWYDSNGARDVIQSVLGGGRLAADSAFPDGEPLADSFDRLRYVLLPSEIERYKQICREGALVLEGTCRELKPGQSEHEIAGLLGEKAISLGFEPAARLVGVDERVRRYRHPIPTNARLKKHVLVVFLGQKKGLYINASRVVHFGPPPDDLIKIHNAACNVDAAYLLNSKVGASYKDIFQAGVDAYENQGYPDHWKVFTQGGVIGYRPREFVVTPSTSFNVMNHQAVAWNPTVTGSKSEDTVLISEDGIDILSEMPDWPMLEITYNGKSIKRPDILVR